jgi:hypothetical protein
MDADPLVGEGTVDPLSPVINAGSLVGLGNLITEDEPGVDYANNPRIQQDTIDIGIFESPYSTPVGFADARIASFLNVYPNPATTTVYVALPGVAIRSLAVLDVQGRTVDATLGRGATSLGFATVDVSRLPPGL